MEATELSQQAGDLAELHLLSSGQMQRRKMRANETLSSPGHKAGPLSGQDVGRAGQSNLRKQNKVTGPGSLQKATARLGGLWKQGYQMLLRANAPSLCPAVLDMAAD